MNKIYKLIWSKTKNCWVVASELAKGHGNNKSRVKNSLLAVFVMTALLAGGVADVQALTQQEKEEIKNEVALDLLDKIAHGGEIPGAKAEYGPTNFPDAIANRIFYYNDVSSKIGEKLKKDGLTLRYFAVRPDYIEPSRDYLERYAKSDWTNVNNDGAFGAHSMALGYRAFAEAKHGVPSVALLWREDPRIRTVITVTVASLSVTMPGRWATSRFPSGTTHVPFIKVLPSGFKLKPAWTKMITRRIGLQLLALPQNQVSRFNMTRKQNYPT